MTVDNKDTFLCRGCLKRKPICALVGKGMCAACAKKIATCITRQKSRAATQMREVSKVRYVVDGVVYKLTK